MQEFGVAADVDLHGSPNQRRASHTCDRAHSLPAPILLVFRQTALLSGGDSLT